MNIGDIAEMAGVSRAAVSRYLNNGYISAEKRERIRKVIEETGYKPSVMGQTLRTKKTKLIGVVLPRINSDTISSIVAGIGSVLHESGYEMLLASTDNNPEKELDFLRIFSNDRVDGVILIATVFTKEHKSILKAMSIPVVVVGQLMPGFTSIYHDDYGAGAALARHLLETGRRRIGFIGVLREDVAVGLNRYLGYRDTLQKAGCIVTPEQSVIADFSVASGYEKMETLLARYPDPDAVICATDSIAVGALKYLKETGRNVPGDIAVTGFGDNTISGVTTPPVTTVHLHYRTSGETAAEKILAMLSGKERATAEIKLSFELVRRGSG